jgi:hypothetical protein
MEECLFESKNLQGILFSEMPHVFPYDTQCVSMRLMNKQLIASGLLRFMVSAKLFQ